MTDDTLHQREQPGNTVAQQGDKNEGQPKLPHEHDESDVSQSSTPRKVIKQAYDDVQSGQQDTDLRGSQGKQVDNVPKNKAPRT